MTSRYFLTLVFFAISGCVSTSSIVPYGKDSFIVAVEDLFSVHSGESLAVKVAQEANTYCASLGKVMVVRSVSNRGRGLIFSCVSETDPEYKRPDIKKAPDTVIEDRRGK